VSLKFEKERTLLGTVLEYAPRYSSKVLPMVDYVLRRAALFSINVLVAEI
jgi:hypothetical protein